MSASQDAVAEIVVAWIQNQKEPVTPEQVAEAYMTIFKKGVYSKDR